MRWLLLVALVSTAVAAPKKKHEHGTLVILIDRSGSMQGARLDAAKDATKAAVGALDPSDDVAVIAFDSLAFKLAPLGAASKLDPRDIDRITAGGGTNIRPALALAYHVLGGVKGKKHVVLLSDGEAPTDGLVELLEKMSHDEDITVSTIGIGDADRSLLQMIQEAGGGRLYMVDDLGALPKVFMKEVAIALPR
jgi:Ca-activated chloride channel family protein